MCVPRWILLSVLASGGARFAPPWMRWGCDVLERGWRRCGQRWDSLMAGIWILWKGMMNGSVQLRRRWQSITGDGRRRLVLMKVRRQDP